MRLRSGRRATRVHAAEGPPSASGPLDADAESKFEQGLVLDDRRGTKCAAATLERLGARRVRVTLAEGMHHRGPHGRRVRRSRGRVGADGRRGRTGNGRRGRAARDRRSDEGRAARCPCASAAARRARRASPTPAGRASGRSGRGRRRTRCGGVPLSVIRALLGAQRRHRRGFKISCRYGYWRRRAR